MITPAKMPVLTKLKEPFFANTTKEDLVEKKEKPTTQEKELKQ